MKRRGSRRKAGPVPAPVAKPAGRNPLRAYLLRHAQNFLSALGRMARQPVGSLLTVAVIGIALCLPAGLHLLVVNGRAVTSNWDSAVDLTAYMVRGQSGNTTARVADRLQARSDVQSVQIIPAERALAEFRELSGFGEALDALETNPLPDVLVVRPQRQEGQASDVRALADELSRMPEIEFVQVDTAWVERFHALLDVLRRAVLLAAAVLAVGVVVIVGNTIRLDIQSRKNEIEVCKLIGASDAFIRRPFLYSGLWYGLGGALVALVLMGSALGLLHEPIRRVAGLYGSSFELIGLDLRSGGAILLGGAVLGWLGSWLAATRHMRQIEPGRES